MFSSLSARRQTLVLSILLAAVFASPACAISASPPCEPSFIGTAGLGHVTPAAAFPFGMVQAGPDTSAKPGRFRADWPHTCGYQHTDEWLWRFSQTHISGTGVASLGDFGILPCAGAFDGAARPARMLKETERAAPGFYAVSIDEDGERIDCAVAALGLGAVYRFSLAPGAKASLLLDLDWGVGGRGNGGCWGKYVLSSSCKFPGSRMAQGARRVFNWNAYDICFAAEFSAPVLGVRKLREGDGVRGEVYRLDFGALADGVLEVRLALSPTSPDAAAANLAAEMKGMEFGEVAARSAAAWEDWLSRIEPGPETPPETAASLRAAMIRTALQPNDWSDVAAEPFYTTLSLWDTFRAVHPLYTVIAPEKVDGFVNSMLRACDAQGYLPIWSLGLGENHCMIGHHAVPVVVDAYLKGFRGFDARRAWRAVRQSLRTVHHPVGDGTWGLLKEDWDVLDKYGYYPYDKMRGGYGGDKVHEAAFFRRRATAWRNVFDGETLFMRGRDSNGVWRDPFDPYALGGGPWTDNDFCEGNAWQYTWHVLHDPEGLIDAFGGRERFVERLLELFEQPPHQYAERPTGDVTGLIGQYAHGNEPSHHVIYFFTLAGRPDLAAKYVRKVFDTQYFARPDGLCGNDDCGQMAAWYIFSALGFYPFDPCGGGYVVGAPQVPSATVKLPGGRRLDVVAENFAKENVYVAAAELNGKPLDGWKLRHEDILNGGKLVFRMSPTP